MNGEEMIASVLLKLKKMFSAKSNVNVLDAQRVKQPYIAPPKNANTNVMRVSKLERIEQSGNTSSADYLHSLGNYLNYYPYQVTYSRQEILLKIKELLDKKKFSHSQYYAAFKWSDIGLAELEILFERHSLASIPTILMIASFNHSGWVRAKSLALLVDGENPNLIRFILFRLVDWLIGLMLLQRLQKKAWLNSKNQRMQRNLHKTLT